MLLDTTLIDGFEKIWRTASDERVCKTCGGLDGKIFAFDQRCFYSSYSKGIVPPALYRTQAHELMGDQLVGRAKLDRDQPNWSWEGKIADKMQRKGMTREEAIFDIYKTAIKSNANVNAKWGCRMARKKYAYSYNVCDQANENLFYRQCAALVKNIPGLEPDRLVQDVDGTLIQTYQHKRGELKVVNDCDTWALYIDSDFDIDPYFE